MKKNYSSIKNLKKGCIAFLLTLCGLFGNTAFAQKNIGWTGAVNNDWTNAGNWNYPAITSVATFAGNVANITLTAANTDIAVGDKVTGYGIPFGATITAIDVTSKIITLSSNTIAGVGTPGTNVQFTFAAPKVALSGPTIVDIALISNGGNPTLPAGSYYIGGLTISNETGAITGSTLTIPADVEIFIEAASNEAVLIKGGNIVNNGYLDIKSFLGNGTNSATFGSNNTVAAYGMTFSLPAVVPTVPTEYTYSGSGTLKIDTSAGNQFSGGIMLNGAHANAGNATYKILFNGTTNLLLSAVKSATNTASTHLFRAVGIGALAACKVILGGTGFDIGDSFSGGVNGLIAASGGGIDVSIASGTTINVFSNINNPMPILSMYAFGATSIPSFITNNGTLTIKGPTLRSPLSLSAQNNAIVNVVNNGIFDLDVNSNVSGISITNNGGATLPADVNITNTGTMTLKTLPNGGSWGAAITMTTFSGAPNMHVNNSGTLNLKGSNYNFGSKVYNPLNVLTQTGTSRITNSGTLNTDQELRSFYTINTSTGNINFASNPANILKVSTFTIPIGAAADLGTTYTDSNLNVYTVVSAKVAATGTSLITTVAANAITPPVVVASVGPPVVAASALTKTGAGAGDASIIFTALATNNNNAFFAPTLNSGTINTNTGVTAMTGISGVTTPDPTSVLSPGGDTGKGIAFFGEVAADLYTLRGTLKIQASASATAGVDYDQLKLTGALDIIDISAATLDLTGIYIPTVLTTIDIIITNTTLLSEGGVIGEFASVVGKPNGWTVVYPGGLGGKVQLAFDPNLATTQFSNFKFSVYPNPTSDEVNLSSVKNISKVELYNLLGQKVLSDAVNDTQKRLSISNLQKGVYLMEVTIDNTKETFKIIKQ